MLARRLSISLALRPVSPFLPRSVFQHLTFPAAEDITRSHAFLPPSRPFHRFIHTKTPATSNIAPRNRFIHTKNPASSNVPPSAATKTATEAATKPAPYTFSGLKTRFNRIWNKYGYTAFGTYAVVYVFTWQCFCWGLHYEYIDVASIMGSSAPPSDGIAAMLDPVLPQSVVNLIKGEPILTTMFVGWLGCKVFEPVRWAATIILTPKVSDMWRASGFAHAYLPIKKKQKHKL